MAQKTQETKIIQNTQKTRLRILLRIPYYFSCTVGALVKQGTKGKKLCAYIAGSLAGTYFARTGFASGG